MITNSRAPVIPSHDSSEVQKDDRQNGYKIRKEINLNLKVINMLVVILSYFRSTTTQIKTLINLRPILMGFLML
jgi:hypothetical protein